MTTENAFPEVSGTSNHAPGLAPALPGKAGMDATEGPTVNRGRERLLGVDFARALALLGMMAAHFGASTNFGGSFWESVGATTHGRSYILFVFLAGISVSLANGGKGGLRSDRIVEARTKLIVRAVCIAIIGSALVTLDSSIIVILPTYAAMFVIAVFFLNADTRTLVQWGVILLIIGGFLGALAWFMSYTFYVPIPFPEVVGGYAYPLLPLTGVFLLGMVIGRIDLSNTKAQITLLGAGAGIALLAYTSTMLFTHPYDSERYSEVTAQSESLDPLVGKPWSATAPLAKESESDYEAYEYGSTAEENWQKGSFVDFIDQISFFGEADPHTGSPAEMFGGTGLAAAILALCLLLFNYGNRVAELAFRPLIAMGSMSLTIYVIHVLTHGLFELEPDTFSGGAWVLTVLVSSAFSGLWKQKFSRGPLEACIAKLVMWFITSPNLTRK